MGKWSDLVLLNANPLEDIANASSAAGVLIHGQWIDGKELDRRMEALRIRLAGGTVQ